MRITSRRLTRFDELGLRRALTDRTVTVVVAAMAFLAALAIALWMGAALLTGQWENGAVATLTVQVPDAASPDASGSGTRLKAVHDLLAATPGVLSVDVLSDDQINTLLRPWLGTDLTALAVPVPSVIAVRLTRGAGSLSDLSGRLNDKAPGTILEDHAALAGRLGALAGSLRLCSGVVLLLVALVTAIVIAFATRSTVAARRETVLIVHQLGATDGMIAQRFATSAAILAGIGGLIGGILALPAVFGLAMLAAPLGGALVPTTPATALAFLPLPLWLSPLGLAIAAAAIGYLTIQLAMRRWLRRLP